MSCISSESTLKVLVHILNFLFTDTYIYSGSLDGSVIKDLIQHNQPLLTLIIVFPYPSSKTLPDGVGFNFGWVFYHLISFHQFLQFPIYELGGDGFCIEPV